MKRLKTGLIGLVILGVTACNDINQTKADGEKFVQDENERDINRNDTQARVKWCLQSVYQAKEHSGEIEKGERVNYAGLEYNKLVKYDSLGNETDFIEYNSKRNVYSKFISKYNNKGNIMEREATRIEGKDITFKQKTYEYDANNYLKEFKWYGSNGDLGHKVIYEYDDNGNVSTSYFYNYYGSLVYRKTYKYDKKANLINCSAYDESDRLSFRLTYKYDENNNEIEHREIDGKGGVTHKNTRKYDDNHNVIEHIKYHSETDRVAIYTYKYTYDKQGNYVEKVCFKNSIPEFLIERSYYYYNQELLGIESEYTNKEMELLSEPKNNQIRMLKLGSYKHGEISPANLKGDWWGMFIEGDSTYFRKVEVIFTALEPDQQYDWEWSISLENDEKCDWLIQGISFDSTSVKYESSTKRNYGGMNLRESKTTCIDAVYSCFISDYLYDDLGYQLIYRDENGESQQVIKYLGYSEAYMREETPIYVDIDWIGDMDGDGFNDFILSYDSSELERKTVLYLSAEAQEGKLVKEVAFVLDRGC